MRRLLHEDLPLHEIGQDVAGSLNADIEQVLQRAVGYRTILSDVRDDLSVRLVHCTPLIGNSRAESLENLTPEPIARVRLSGALTRGLKDAYLLRRETPQCSLRFIDRLLQCGCHLDGVHKFDPAQPMENQHGISVITLILRKLRYVPRDLRVRSTPYVKTDVTVFPDGRFTLTTTNRGEAASRWVTQIRGKKILRPVPSGDESERGE